MRLLIFAMKFFFIGAFFIISTQNLALAHEGNLDVFAQEYGEWIVDVAQKVGGLTAYVVKVEWLPEVEEDSLALGLIDRFLT